MEPVRVLFVCMGNICRSPTAEGVFRHKVATRGLVQRIETDSAGTHAYHIGHSPDRRAQAHALQRGYDLAALRARQVVSEDFTRFDYVLAMDWDNHALLESQCVPAARHKIRLLMQFARKFPDQQIVPDPYYGGAAGFEAVLDYIEDACDGLIDVIVERNRDRISR